ncbi:MAG: FAD-dependent oxidoreductase [Chloroflexi bacterium]|uniref:FAD-dependent oxidoreductase n=1 Tax=Candidatus Chlorohelix allophototropha TaxID=3003348 RepID=A0A8T7LUA7_9CHLR|nr:FAD-dependent oxidoreductase [Chloroflexota bacterium]WJW66356.1 FAD-dependent oxidoreductase [Chloroflexota bacterium L227-S17]
MQSEPRACVIIGGGVAGLTAALHLTERGLLPLVLEAEPAFLGGRWSTKPAVELTSADGRRWSFPAEHGIHGLWWQYKNLKAMAARHGFMPELVFADRQQWVHGESNGKILRCEMGRGVRRTILWPAPFHYGALSFYPPFVRMLTFSDIFKIPVVLGTLLTATAIDPLVEGVSLEGKTVADLCKGWPPRMTAFLATLARSGLSAHLDQVPAAGFIAFLRFYSLLRRDSQRFHYLPTDPETALIAPMAEKIVRAGAEIRKDARVERLERVGETGWVVFLENGEKIEALHVIVATDAPAASRIFNNSPTTAAITADMKWPEGRHTGVLRFWFSESPRKRTAEAGIISGDFILDNFFWLHRILNSFKEWHTATGGSALETHIYSQETLDLDDATIIAQAREAVERIFPKLKGKILHVTFQRNPPSHTLFGIGSLAHHMGVRTPFPGLSCCGDWVRNPLPALFLERAVATAILAANAALEEKGLPVFELEKYDKPEFFARLISGWISSARV